MANKAPILVNRGLFLLRLFFFININLSVFPGFMIYVSFFTRMRCVLKLYTNNVLFCYYTRCVVRKIIYFVLYI